MKDAQEEFEKQAEDAAAGYSGKAPETEVTVADLDSLVEAIFAKSAEIEAAEDVVKARNQELTALKAKGVLYLKALGRESYKTDLGSISIDQKWRVNLPQTDEDKSKLFDWLRDQGIFDKYATVNSNSLNSLYMAEWDSAKKRGEGMEFSLPGIGAPKLFEALKPLKSRTKKQET